MDRLVKITMAITVLTLSLYAQNLLTNGGFEQSSGSFGNGNFTTSGWEGSYYGYSSMGFISESASEGSKKIDFNTGASIQTNTASRVSVTPGYLYKFSFDLQTYRSTLPSEFLGTFGYIFFYNASGTLIKTEFTQSLQDDGVSGWQTQSLYAVAPAGAAKAAVKIDASRGGYPNEDIRNVYVDNCTFEYVAEDIDRIALRSAPLMVEPGKSYKLTIRYATVGSHALPA